MKEVWKLDKATVSDVYQALREKRTIAYTTVMTMMKILEDKGYLKKSKAERAYLYKPSKTTAAGRQRHGPRLRGPRVRWCRQRAAASSCEGRPTLEGRASAHPADRRRD